MTQPTKADLAAAVAKLAEENAGLRDLLGAVQVMADAPKPAAYSDRYYWECTERLSSIAVWAKLDYAGPDEAAVIRGWAKAVREKAAEPVRYEVRAEPEPAACGARPYPAGSEGDDGTECALPAGHDGAHDDTPAGSGAPDWCPATTVYDEGADHLPLYCDRERGHHGSHHAPGPDEGSEVAWSDEAAASVAS